MVGPAYQAAASMADSERCINFFVEKNDSPNAPVPWALLPTPGTSGTAFATVAQAPIRGHCAGRGRDWFVAGYELYEVDSAGTCTARGVVDADTNPATLCLNGPGGDQLFVTSGGKGYLLDLTSAAFSTVLSSGATMGAFLDARFLALNTTDSSFRCSDLEDGTTWNALNVATRTAGADPWKAMYVNNRLIFLLGDVTSEVWWSVGSGNPPFAPIQEAFMQQGIVAPFSGTINGSRLSWLAQNAQGRGVFVSATGYEPSVISTPALAATIQGYGTITDAIGWSHQQAGHEFSGWTFPTDNRTWCVDAATGFWHERLFWDTTSGTWKAFRLAYMVSAFGLTLAADRMTGSLYALAPTRYYDVDGSLIRRMRQPPRLDTGQKRATIRQLQLVMDVGVGLSTGQGNDPQVMLECSDDGGKTFGNEAWTTAGAIGAYDTRVVWHQLGQATNPVHRFVMTDPVPWRIVDAELEITMGTS